MKLLPYLAVLVLAVGAGAAHAAGKAEARLHCNGQVAAPVSLNLALGKAKLMQMPETVEARSVGNPAVLHAKLVAPDALYVVGLEIGSSNMMVQGRSGLCTLIEVVVGLDAGAVQNALATLLPEQKELRVSAAGDTLVISGTVDDAPTVERVMEVATAFARRQPPAPDGSKPTATAAASSNSLSPGGGSSRAVATAAAPAGAAIINLLSVRAPQQVMLEVKIAEVSKSLLDKLETGSTLNFGGGSWSSALSSSFLSGTLRGLLRIGGAAGNHVALAAEKQDGLVRILAEPTVMALSGQEGSFLAGGKIFIPVGQDNNKVTLEEKEFGVGLRFTPTVLAGGRINLRVAPEVSELSREGIGISANGISGNALLPLITTRRAATTVELYDGQSFAIGGLIRDSQSSGLRGLPVLGDLPVLGALFRSTDFQQDRTELLFVVTPHLVKPLPASYALPTDGLQAPDRVQLNLQGRLEAAPATAPAPLPAPDNPPR
ncbi:type II and III secretion system protein family protein [Pseudoduganella danionis]|uniref:Type II and III secretion system protein family protein n=1 Tax=Pseudoduganella danionis TaxID=1890295 RepID=A0ABW9SSD0_9BURK|nr:type II and III secretion system protein family protein [Pseudoduganella danionis]MTW34093.1 type II and III secretion system protein family protein [Pseudoduganella danionis]